MTSVFSFDEALASRRQPGVHASMQIDPQGDSLHLRKHKTMQLRDAAGWTVKALAGMLWITQDYDTRDIVLQPGESFVIDRDAQRTNESYTGIPSIFLQDQAVTESMGTIYDRSQEHLGTSDAMIIRTRRRLIEAAKALRDSGALPPACDNPSAYAQRSGGVVLPRGANWIDATQELRKAFVEHPELSREVLGGVPAV